MGKRNTSRQQRRKCPNLRRVRPTQSQGGKKPSRQPLRLTKSGLPILKDEDLTGFFSDKSVQESFAEMVEESLGAPDTRKAFREKKLGSKRLRSIADRLREYPAPQGEIDLHRLTGPEAAVRIENFIQTALGKGLQTLRIITGKGLHSEGPAVLPEVTEHKLFELKERGLLLNYRWEKKKRERSGAVIVYLL
ncbi:MAG: Smr/MutS family protein [Deltaproteobacteria bacterium]|jgi:DNA-nicking Smr family endonuclease